MSSPPPTHPLGPLDFAVTVVAGLLATVLVVLTVLTIVGEGSVGGVGADEVCVVTHPGTVPFGSDGGRGGDRVLELRPGGRWYTDTVSVCAEEPPTRITAAGATGIGIESLFALGALLFVSRLIRYARRTRIFSSGVAVRTRQLGWLLGVGSLLAAAVAAVCDVVVLRAAVKDVSWWSVSSQFDFPWLLVILAFGGITVGRVLEWAVVVQEEVDATV